MKTTSEAFRRDWRRWGAVLVVAASASGGCALIQPRTPTHAQGGTQTADPNPAPDLTPLDPNNPSPVQHIARTTLLEENEHLRKLLSETLSDKQRMERELNEVREERLDCADQVADQTDVIASLTEEVEALHRDAARLDAETVRLESERRTLAEMYAVEKRQRLTFEKELLEREIATRTHGAQGRKP